MIVVKAMLTTVDNPYDPFVDFPEWYAWDTSNGYNTSSFLARVVNTSYELSDTDMERSIEEAIDQIVAENTNGMYRKVTRE